MRIIIFGSTGSVGQLLVEQALQSHTVTAFVRNPSKIAVTHPNLTIAQGDVLDQSAVVRAIGGHDAVFCVIGAGRNGKIRSEGTRNIIHGMQQVGVKRLICQSSLGVGDSKGNLNFFWKYIMFGMLLKDAYRDHEEQERIVMKSNLEWTIVRPGAFTNGPLTGKYRHGFDGNAEGLTLKISRADVAHFLLKQLTDNRYVRKAAGQSY
jgi:putative NADH-flavin reductase